MNYFIIDIFGVKFSIVLQFFCLLNLQNSMFSIPPLFRLILALSLLTLAFSTLLPPSDQTQQIFCPEGTHQYRSQCWNNIQNCQIYLNSQQCQICSYSFFLSENRECQSSLSTSSGQNSVRKYEIRSALQPNQVEQINSIDKLLHDTEPKLLELVGKSILFEKENNRKYYRLVFEKESGFNQYIVLVQEEMSMKYTLAGRKKEIYPINTRIISKITLEQYEKIIEQIKNLSPYLADKPFAILRVLWNIQGNDKQLVVYALQESYGLFWFKVPLRKEDQKYFTEEIERDIENLSVKIIKIVENYPTQGIYSVTFKSANLNIFTVETQFANDLQQFKIISEPQLAQSSPNSLLENKLNQYFIKLNYLPSDSCPSKIPTFNNYINTNSILEKQASIDEFLSTKTFQRVREFIMNCYPEYIFNDLQSICYSKGEKQEDREIHLIYNVFASNPIKLFILFNENIQTGKLQLKSLVATPINDIKFYRGSQLHSYEVEIAQILMGYQKQMYEGNWQISDIFEIEVIPWRKFEVEMERLFIRINLNHDPEYRLLEFMVDFQLESEYRMVTGPILTKKQKYDEIPSESQQIQPIDNYIKGAFLSAEDNEVTAYKFFKSQNRGSHIILSYLVGNQLVVFEYNGEEVKEILRIDEGSLETEVQVINFIQYGQIPKEQPTEINAAPPLIDEEMISEQISVFLHSFNLPPLNSIKIVEFKELYNGLYVRISVQMTLKDSSVFFIVYDHSSYLGNRLQLLSQPNDAPESKRQNLNEGTLTKMQRRYFSSFLKEKNSIALALNLSQNEEHKTSFLTQKFGIIEITTEISGNPPSIRFEELRVKDDGFMKIGFDRLSLMNLNTKFSNIEKSLKAQNNEIEKCELIVWRAKTLTQEFYHLKLTYQCSQEPEVIEADFIGSSQATLFLEFKNLLVDLEEMLQKDVIRRDTIRNEIIKTDSFTLAQNKLFSLYSHYLAGAQLLQIRNFTIENQIFYSVTYLTDFGILQAISAYNFISGQTKVLSLTPTPEMAQTYLDQHYITDIIKVLGLPEQYLSSLAVNKSWYSPVQYCLFTNWLLCVT